MASALSPCAKIICFFGTETIFLPAPMVARKVSGSNPRCMWFAADDFIEQIIGPNHRLHVSNFAHCFKEARRSTDALPLAPCPAFQAHEGLRRRWFSFPRRQAARLDAARCVAAQC